MVGTSVVNRQTVAMARKKYSALLERRRAFGEIGNSITVRVTHPDVRKAAKVVRNTVNSSNLVQIVLPENKSSGQEHGSTKLLPANVKDIDRNNQGNVFLVTEYVNDIYLHLRHLEDKYPLRKNHLDGRRITSKMRATVVDWMVDVQVQYKLLQETLHLSVRLLDEFLEKTTDLKPDQLQLAAVTSMLLASKYEETYAPGLKQFVFVCDKAYTGEQVLEMEQRMLRTLDFSLTRALVILFLRRYAMAADSNSLQHAYSKYFVDLSLTSSSFCHVKPSQVAAAAIFITKCVMRNHVNSLFWTPTMSFYSGYTLYDFAPLVSRLAELIASSKQSRLTAVRRKYSTKQLHEISLNPNLGPTSPVLKSLSSFRHFDVT